MEIPSDAAPILKKTTKKINRMKFRLCIVFKCANAQLISTQGIRAQDATVQLTVYLCPYALRRRLFKHKTCVLTGLSEIFAYPEQLVVLADSVSSAQ